MSSWLFLAVSLWGAWFTYNAHRPRGAGPRFSIVSFFGGWLTSELALHHIAWQAVATLGFGLAGAFGAWPGLLGLGVTLASWVGLGLAQLRAMRSGEVVEAALREGLGPEYALAIRPELRETLVGDVDWLRVARPFPIRSRDVERIRDVRYGRAKGVDLDLDVYRSSSAPQNAPVLFQIHGGGWTIGSKDEQGLPLMTHLAQRGWVCVAANYRLSPHATFPDHLIDLKRARAWIGEHIAEHGGDPDFVAVTGGSAGGHLAALVALTANDPEYQPGFEAVDTSVRCCVPFYGVYDFTNHKQTLLHDGMTGFLEKQIMKGSLDEIRADWERASPIHRVHADAPPFFVIHGELDTLVPVGEAREFVTALRRVGCESVTYAELPGAQHAFELFPSVRTLYTINAVDRFLANVYSRYLEDRGEAAA